MTEQTAQERTFIWMPDGPADLRSELAQYGWRERKHLDDKGWDFFEPVPSGRTSTLQVRMRTCDQNLANVARVPVRPVHRPRREYPQYFARPIPVLVRMLQEWGRCRGAWPETLFEGGPGHQ